MMIILRVCVTLAVVWADKLEQVYQDEGKANSFLRSRVRRDNKDILEEIHISKHASLQRECVEETCMQEELAEVFERSAKEASALSTSKYNSTVIRNELKRLIKQRSTCSDADESDTDCQFLNSPDIETGERCDEQCQIYFKLLKESCSAPDTILLTQPLKCNPEGTMSCNSAWGERKCVCNEGYYASRDGYLTCESESFVDKASNTFELCTKNPMQCTVALIIICILFSCTVAICLYCCCGNCCRCCKSKSEDEPTYDSMGKTRYDETGTIRYESARRYDD